MTAWVIPDGGNSRRGSVLLLNRKSHLRTSWSACTNSLLLTVCSGIYVPNDEGWPAQFRGIGIRIEDSVCVGDDNPLNLTTEAVKEVRLVPFLSRMLNSTNTNSTFAKVDDIEALR